MKIFGHSEIDKAQAKLTGDPLEETLREWINDNDRTVAISLAISCMALSMIAAMFSFWSTFILWLVTVFHFTVIILRDFRVQRHIMSEDTKFEFL